MKYIVYKTTCLVNNKIYIGVHGTKDLDKFDGYLGCGVYVSRNFSPITEFQKAVREFGCENFHRETLFVFDNIQDAYKKEKELVSSEFIARTDVYNMICGGRDNSYYRHDFELFQYSLNGVFIARWSTWKDAVKYYNCNDKRFDMAISDKRSAFNCYWTDFYVEKIGCFQISQIQA